MMTEHFKSCRPGSSHRERRLPCQDQVLLRFLPGMTVAALSDGHSCALRGGISSRAACLVFLRAVSSGCSPEELPVRIKTDYDRLIAKHLALRPVTEAEQAQLNENRSLCLYGATLMGVALEAERSLVYQLGDGSLSLLRRDGSLFPLTEDPACFLSFTPSLSETRESTQAHSRCFVFHEPAAAAALCSDGYAFRSSRPWTLLSALGDPGLSLSDAIPPLLERASGTDDQSVILLRDPAALCSPAFREGLNETLARAALEVKAKKLRREAEELSVFFKVFRKSAACLCREGDPLLRSRLYENARRRALRYIEVQKELEQLNAGPTERRKGAASDADAV